MARTKQSVIDKHRSTQQAAAAAGRCVRKRGPLNIKAARIMSSQEIAMLPPVKPARSSQSEEDSDMDEEESIASQVRTRHATPSPPLISTANQRP